MLGSYMKQRTLIWAATPDQPRRCTKSSSIAFNVTPWVGLLGCSWLIAIPDSYRGGVFRPESPLLKRVE